MKIGIKEQVKAGQITAKQALIQLMEKAIANDNDKSVTNSHTYKWLLARVSVK